jgi:dihydrodipicolinate synthase/N-acetylneuraminate lyase
MPGAGFADIQAQIWDWYQAGKKKQARELFAKMLMMAVLEQHTGYIVQKEILKRRGVFSTTVMRDTRKMGMDEWDQRELSEIFEVLGPYFRVK